MSSAEMTKLMQQWGVVSLLVCYKQAELLRINQWWEEVVPCEARMALDMPSTCTFPSSEIIQKKKTYSCASRTVLYCN
jgi:hypothetical protein